jgi:signal transduction histidine kinase
VSNQNLLSSVIGSRTVAIYTAAVILVLIVVALLSTRQTVELNQSSQTLLFVLIVTIGYGIGSWILLEYTKRISTALRTKSSFIRRMHLFVTIVQFSLLGILLFVIYYNSVSCGAENLNFCMSARIASVSVNAIASAAATIILGLFSYKFFVWYKLSNKNFILLLYGTASVVLALSIGGDAFAKIAIQQVIVEKTMPGSVPEASFIYKSFEKYPGQIQYKVVDPNITTLYIVPDALKAIHKFIVALTSDPRYVLLWIGTFVLLHLYFQRIGQKVTKFPIKYWILLTIPLILYLVGSGLIFSLPNDSDYRYYQRIIYRAGSIGSNLLFALAIFIITRNVPSGRVKDYLTVAAIGIATVGISFSASALQQTYGVAAHSLVLLSSYLFIIGFYASAIFLSQDAKLRRAIKGSAIEESNLLVSVGLPHIEQEIERRVLTVAQRQEKALIEETGVQPSLTSEEMKQYLSNVLKEIKLLHSSDEILNKGKEILEYSSEFLACLRYSGLRLAYDNYFNMYQRIMEKCKKGQHKGIRWVTTVDQNTAELVKAFLEIGVQIRHVKNMPPIDFVLSDKELTATIQKVEKGSNFIQSLLVSSESAYIDHFVSIFNDLWSEGIDAKDRIKSIEQGLEPEFHDVINDRKKASQILIDLAKSVKKEALIVLPNDKALTRIDKLGIIDYLTKESKNGAIIKIICPLTERNSVLLTKLSQGAPNIKILNGNNSTYGMFIVDGAKFIRAELSNPIAENFSDAIGFTIYSNSKLSVESFKSVFELLWKEHMLNDELKKADSIQKDFINIAAHELKTPIQPILSLSEIVSRKVGEEERRYMEVIIRNAKRLQRLTENILDVTRIESQLLILDKEHFNLNDTISNTIVDVQNQVKENKNIKIEFLHNDDIIFIKADKQRIIEVISNLLSNSVKFTEDGTITIATKKQDDDQVIVTVKDSGRGIDDELIPNLFTKFFTKSQQGTGLGLYISKSIVEAHGGRIWAENNTFNGAKGASFHFSLPIEGKVQYAIQS